MSLVTNWPKKQAGDLDAQNGHQICVRHSKGSQNHDREKRKQQFQLLPNHHNLDFSCKAQKYTNAVIFVTYNPTLQGCYKRQFKLLDTENLEPILPSLRKWVILLFIPPVQCIQLLPAPFHLCVPVSHPRKPSHHPAFLPVPLQMSPSKAHPGWGQRKCHLPWNRWEWKERECSGRKACALREHLVASAGTELEGHKSFILPSLTDHPLHDPCFTNKNSDHIQNSARHLFCRREGSEGTN